MGKGSEKANDRSAPVNALFLMFERDCRPHRSELIDAISAIQDTTISHDPFQRDAAHRHAREALGDMPEGTWLELLKWGMTFDCLGLAPGPKLVLPPVRHRLSLSSDIDLASHDAIALTPGPHLADASSSIPVVRAMLDAATALIEALGDGSCSGIVLQDPVQMGYQSVKTLVAAIHGEKSDAYISTGEYVATPENMNEEKIQALLKPSIID